MSQEDVPGCGVSKHDTLACGVWAEHDDGSLLFVEANEGGRVIYSLFDMDKEPVTEYRDAMATGAFQRQFSFSFSKSDKWIWHNRTPFPWDKIISAGGRDGVRHADVEDTLTEAERIRRSRMRHRDNATQRARRARDINDERPVDLEEIATRVETTMGKAGDAIVDKIQKVIATLKPGRGKR